MLEIKDVPFRVWDANKLGETNEGKKVMRLAYREMARGKAVEVTQSQPLTVERIDYLGRPIYDTISLTVTD